MGFMIDFFPIRFRLVLSGQVGREKQAALLRRRDGMIYEKSCGAVIYTYAEGVRLYLIEQMKGGHFSMCKGHTEGSETEEETARREIREETGLTVPLNTDFRREIWYSPYEGCRKKVVFFLAESKGQETAVQPEEVRRILWLPYEAALARLSFEDEHSVLEDAEKYLKNEKSC